MISPVKIWRRQKRIYQLIGKRGKIVTFSLVRVPPKDFAPQAPYPVVIIELAANNRLIGQLVDWKQEDLRSGREVIVVLRRARTEEAEEVIPYTIKFKPT